MCAAGDQADDGAGDDRQHHAGDVVQAEFGRAPLPLQRCADHVVEVEKEHQPDGLVQAVVTREENKRHQAPDLPMEDGIPVKGQKADGPKSGEHRQKIYNSIAGDDVFHQVWNTEVWMAVRKAVHRAVELFQRESLQKANFDPSHRVINYYNRLLPKSHV